MPKKVDIEVFASDCSFPKDPDQPFFKNFKILKSKFHFSFNFFLVKKRELIKKKLFLISLLRKFVYRFFIRSF